MIPDTLHDQLLASADAKIAFDPNGLLDSFNNALTERSLNAEMERQLSGDEQPGNVRNDDGHKWVLTETVKLELEIPRDRRSTLDPRLIAKYQRLFPGFDDKILSVHGCGMSVREVACHLREPYGVEVSPDLISTVTDAVLDEVSAWQARPLEPVYSLIFFDTLWYEVREDGTARNKAVQVAHGVRVDGTKEILSLWLEQNEGTRFWLRVFNELRNRSVGDILVAVVDGRKGLPDAIQAVFPQTLVQTSIVHLVRTSLEFISWKDHKAVATALRAINADDAKAVALEVFEDGACSRKYPAIDQIWRRAWNELVQLYAFRTEVRRILRTINALEFLKAKPHWAVRTRGHFPTYEAALKLIFLVLNRIGIQQTMPTREWVMAKAQFAVFFGQLFTKAFA